jgi:pimeloyl-ACP methyl ester carboxylesterase
VISWPLRHVLHFFLALILLICVIPTYSNAKELEPSRAIDQLGTQYLEMSPEQKACERAAETEWWHFSYSSSFVASDLYETFSYKTNQSANTTFTLGMPDRSPSTVTWTVLQSDGHGKIDDQSRDDDGDSWNTAKGDGKAQTVGWLHLDRTECTYDLELFVTIPATLADQDQSYSTPALVISEIQVFNKPIEVDPQGALVLQSADTAVTPLVSPRLAWSGQLPLLTDYTNSNSEDSYFVESTGATGIRAAHEVRGQKSAGNASISWKGTRMGISSLKFQQQQVPNKHWVDLPAEGTVDGNKVRIIAKIDNPTHNTMPGPVRFIDAETNELLPKGEIAFSLAASKSGEVVYEWDTQGWAWNKGRAQGAHSNRKILIEFGPEDDIYDSVEQAIIVRPKPVVLVHGLNSNAGTWASYPSMLKSVNSAWNGYAIASMRTGNDPVAQESSYPITSNAFELAKYIEEVRAKEQAWHIDLVAHSMGGLISRQYIHSLMQVAPSIDDRPLARNLVMLGTPNQGSLCAIGLSAINSISGSENVHAPTELMPSVVERFNKEVTQRRGVHFSVIAGNFYPFPCRVSIIPKIVLSDLVVTVKSAHYIYSDIGFTSEHHMAMTSDQGIFKSWVLPRLALGVGANPALVANQTNHEAAPSQADDEEELSPQFSTIASHNLAAQASVDLPFKVTSTKGLGVMLVGSSSVTASLIDPTGKSVDTIAAGSERALQPFVMLQANVPQAGEWKLRLQNQGQQAATIRYGVILGEPSFVSSAWFERDAQGKGGLLLQQASNNGANVKASKVSAKIVLSDGTTKTIELLDNGKNGDAVAGDGIFSVRVADAVAATVSAELNGEVRISVAEEKAPNSQSSFSIYLPLVQR